MALSAGPSLRLELKGLSKEDDVTLLRYLAQKYHPVELFKMMEDASQILSGPPAHFSFSSQSSNGDVRWRSSQSSMLTVDSASSLELAYSSPSPSFRHIGTQGAPSATATPMSTHTVIPETPEPLPEDRTAQTKAYPCPLCAQEHVHDGAGRSGDFVRHLKTHQTNAQWTCKVNDCGVVFDIGTAYKLHMKTAHPGTHVPESEVKLALLPQMVFGCGYEGCTKVYAATSEHDISKSAELYFKHIKEHIQGAKREGAEEPVWHYSIQIRNLLRQKLVHDHWLRKTEALPRHRFVWHRHNSNVLMKMLQCGVIPNIPELISIAAKLGSGSYCQPNAHQFETATFALPAVGNIVAPHDPFLMKPESLYRSSGSSEALALQLQSVPSRSPGNTFMNQVPGLDFPTSFPNAGGPIQGSSEYLLPYNSGTFCSPNHSFTNTTNPDHHMYTPTHPVPQLPSQYFVNNFADSEPTSFDRLMKELPQNPPQQSRPPTPGQRFTKLARKSLESLRGRKSSISQTDIDMSEAVPPLPATSLSYMGSRAGN